MGQSNIVDKKKGNFIFVSLTLQEVEYLTLLLVVGHLHVCASIILCISFDLFSSMGD